MKTDRLEQFVRDHREDFDDLTPDPGLWNQVELPEKKTIKLNWKTIGVRVAATVVIFISAYYFHDFMDARQDSRMASNQQLMDNEAYQSLMEAEVFYTTQINYKKDELFRRTSSHPQLRDIILEELTDLDLVLQELKADLSDNAANEEVVEAMIQNYRLKLRVLEEILVQLQKPEENEKDEDKTVIM